MTPPTHTALLRAAKQAQDRYDKAQARAEELRLERNARIADAVDGGVSPSRICETTGITRQWVYRAASDHRKANP